jgi:predicted nucleic acid-binding protein
MRVVDLAERHLDLPLGLVDAAVVAVAERLGATTIATLDRRRNSAVDRRFCSLREQFGNSRNQP